MYYAFLVHWHYYLYLLEILLLAVWPPLNYGILSKFCLTNCQNYAVVSIES